GARPARRGGPGAVLSLLDRRILPGEDRLVNRPGPWACVVAPSTAGPAASPATPASMMTRVNIAGSGPPAPPSRSSTRDDRFVVVSNAIKDAPAASLTENFDGEAEAPGHGGPGGGPGRADPARRDVRDDQGDPQQPVDPLPRRRHRRPARGIPVG